MKLCATENCGRPGKGCRLCYKCYYIANRDKKRVQAVARYHKNPEKMRAYALARYHKDLEKGRAYVRTYKREHPNKEYKKAMYKKSVEHASVYSHWVLIYRSKAKSRRRYEGMPFCDDWNPKTGGSYAAGARWIIENLGRRPGTNREYQLHIVNRAIGFMPGNLQWVPQEKHRQEEMINKLLLENQNLRQQLSVQLRCDDCQALVHANQ